MVQSQLKLFEIAPNRMPWNTRTERVVLNMQAFLDEFHFGRATRGASVCFGPEGTKPEMIPTSGCGLLQQFQI
jgi:hypothetical protein